MQALPSFLPKSHVQGIAETGVWGIVSANK